MNTTVTRKEFEKSLTNENPNKDWSKTLKAMWFDANGNWKTAHDIVDGMEDSTAKWVHAYLHRKEGDDWNAGYWYRQAGKTFPKISLEDEQQLIIDFITASQ